MTLETSPGLGVHSTADVKEAREILKTLRQGRPPQRGSHGHILDNWEHYRVAGLVKEDTYFARKITVTMPDGKEIETSVRGIVPINGGRDTLFIPDDSRVITQIFPKHSGRV